MCADVSFSNRLVSSSYEVLFCVFEEITISILLLNCKSNNYKITTTSVVMHGAL